jgi:hypothetical protein
MKIRNTVLMALVLVFLAVPAFSANDVSNNPNNSGIINTGNSATITTGGTGGTGGAGGAGGTGIGVNVTGSHDTVLSPSATGGSVNIGGGILSSTLSPSAKAEAEQKQKQQQKQQQQQGQIQGQKQTNVNDQVIAPEQTVVFKSPTQLMSPPSQIVPELNFGNGRMKDATGDLPNFAIYGIKKLGAEAIVDVLSVNANVKFKGLYKAILSDAKDVAGAKDFKSAEVRIQIIRAEAQKTWTTGGNFGGAGSGLATSGLGGGSGAGSVIPQWGGTKSDDLFTIIYVKVYVGK